MSIWSYLPSWLDPVAYAVRRSRIEQRRRAGFEKKRLRLPGGLEVVYLDTGAEGGKAPLVLLHGIGASKDHWPRIARRLAERFRVVAPDLPGFGESSRPAGGDYGSAAQAGRVRQFAEALGLERFHLGGSSMGGRIAAVYASTHPETLRSLWLLAPSGVKGGQLSEMMQRTARGERIPLFARTAEEYADVLAFTMHKPPDIPTPAYRVLAREVAPHYDLNRRIYDVYTEEWKHGTSTEDALREVPVPVLLVWGTEDRVLDPSGAAILAQAAPRVQVRRVDGIGHLPMLEDPDATARDFLAFQEGLADEA